MVTVEFLLNILLEDHGKASRVVFISGSFVRGESHSSGSDGYGVLRGVGFSLIIK